MADDKPKKSPQRTRVPRPDELTQDTFEFISAIDDYKRSHMISFLTLEHVLEILDMLGYLPGQTDEKPIAGLESAVEGYKEKNERLFPNWSEIFQIVLELGYIRKDVA